MKIVDKEGKNGDKEKLKKQNKEYYARGKENRTKRSIANGEDSSNSPCVAASQQKVPSIQVKVYTAKEKRKIRNEKYYTRCKEKLKKRRIANGEGNGQSKKLLTNISAVNVCADNPFQNSVLLEMTPEMPNLLGVQRSENLNQVISHSLLAEMEKLSEVKNIAVKFHEAIKLKLKSEYEKEVAEMISQMIRKYEGICEKVDAEFQLKRKEIDIKLDKVVVNKILAEALRSKCQDLDVYGYRTCKLS